MLLVPAKLTDSAIAEASRYACELCKLHSDIRTSIKKSNLLEIEKVFDAFWSKCAKKSQTEI